MEYVGCLLVLLVNEVTGLTDNFTGKAHISSRLTLSAERRLINDLLDNYRQLGVNSRPVSNASKPVDVKFGLGMVQMELEEKKNMMFISAWTRFLWHDEYLMWDPSFYDDIKSVKLPSHEIWNPDIMLYNTATTETHTRAALAVVTYDGLVTWFPHRVFESSCSIDVRYFPFDNQTCYMYFGSWTYTSREINISLAFPSGIDLSTLDSEYNASSKWEVTSVVAVVMKPDPDYSLLCFKLNLSRKMMFSSYILTAPAVFLSFLTLVVFALPVEDMEKTHLGLAIFGSLLLLLLIIVEAAPPTASAVPLLGIFYCFTTVIVIVSVVLTTIIVKMSNPGTTSKCKPVPKVLRQVIIQGLGKLLCYRESSCYKERHRRSDYVDVGNNLSSYASQENHTELTSENINADTELRYKCMTCQTLCIQVREILGAIREFNAHQRELDLRRERDNNTVSEWVLLASVLDRIFFWIYLVAIVLATAFLFPWV